MNRYLWMNGYKTDLSNYNSCSVCGHLYKVAGEDGCWHVYPYVKKMGDNMMGTIRFVNPTQPIQHLYRTTDKYVRITGDTYPDKVSNG